MSSPPYNSRTSRSSRKRQNEHHDDDDDEIVQRGGGVPHSYNHRSSPVHQPSSPLASSPQHHQQQQLPSSPAIPFDAGLDDDEDEEIRNDIADLNPSDEEDGDDLMDNLENDYRANPEQDQYDLGDGNIDDTQEYDEMDAATRRRIDEQLNRRDAILNNANRSRGGAFLDDEEDEDLDGVDQYEIGRAHV